MQTRHRGGPGAYEVPESQLLVTRPLNQHTAFELTPLEKNPSQSAGSFVRKAARQLESPGSLARDFFAKNASGAESSS